MAHERTRKILVGCVCVTCLLLSWQASAGPGGVLQWLNGQLVYAFSDGSVYSTSYPMEPLTWNDGQQTWPVPQPYTIPPYASPSTDTSSLNIGSFATGYLLAGQQASLFVFMAMMCSVMAPNFTELFADVPEGGGTATPEPWSAGTGDFLAFQNASPNQCCELSIGSQTQYTHADFGSIAGLKPARDTIGTSVKETITLNYRRERMCGQIQVPYGETHFNGDLDRWDHRSLGAYGFLCYHLLEQQSDDIDLNLATGGGLTHLWMEHRIPNFDDPDYASAGAAVGVGKTTKFGDFRLAYAYVPTWNIDGDTELTGHANIDVQEVAALYTVGFGRNLFSSLGATYKYFAGLPSTMDEDGVIGQVTLGYVDADWSASVSFSRSFSFTDVREWGVDLTIRRRF